MGSVFISISFVIVVVLVVVIDVYPVNTALFVIKSHCYSDYEDDNDNEEKCKTKTVS